MNNNINFTLKTSQSAAQKLLYINVVLAALTLFANGSALFFGLIGKAPEVLADLFAIILIMIGAAVVLATAVFAIVKPRFCEKVLSIHAVLLTIGTVMFMLWGLSLASQSMDDLVDLVEQTGVGVSWSVGWFTAMASYSTYLVSFTHFAYLRESSVIVKYAYLWVGLIAFFIDVFIFFRLAAPLM
ncbi:MAG: hypothetical protein H6936_02435 [Burkholderiales bacterium]|nr:hypothetical protein [Nitrosomonas sp.]MCP5273711.1 hypothetical protein [Burkholderiales bacterium]